MKGLSLLCFIPFFDLIKNCVLESMHCIWEEVVKQLCNLWFDSKYHKEDWYIGKPDTLGK